MHPKSIFSVALCALVASAALSVSGCQADPLTGDEFCEKWADAACGPEVLSACQKRESQCQASQAASCRDWLPDDFQDVGVEDCLNAVREAYSDADLSAAELDIVWRLGAPCSSIVVAGESGATCERDADCTSSAGLTCVLKDRATGTCQRAEIVKAGFRCTQPNQTCEPGFYCNGENCIVAADAGDSCKNDTQCGEGLFCEDEECEEQLPMGADCTNDRECESQICYEVDVDERVCVNRIRLSPAEPACDQLK